MKYCNIEIKRRNLPHWHLDNCIQFVTFHLADSLPKSVRLELQMIKQRFVDKNPEPWTQETNARFKSLFPTAINDYLDSGYGKCYLRYRECATIMSDTITYFDGERYKIHRFVIMPNHVHVLVELTGSHGLSQICKSWKNYSALKINRILGKSGKLWHHESWDRMIRNERHYVNVVNYIEKNIKQGGVKWM